MLSNISDLFTMASLVICMLLSGIIFYYLRTRISMLEQSVMDQAQLLQQVVTSLKSSQYRQQMNANANTNANTTNAVQQQDVVNSNQGQMNLIQVSDDSDDSDSSDSSDSSNSSDDSESDNDESGVNVCTLEGSCSKIIDLSTIASYANYSKPFPQTEIKVIELKSNIRSDKDYLGNSSDDDGDDASSDDEDDEDDASSDEDDGDEDDGDEDDGDEDEDKDMNGEKNNARNENEHTESKNDESENQSNVNVNIKKMKSIVIEDLTTSVSLDEMKNMPVNSLRSLAKTKLSNIDVPTINKMSKKDILKALHEE
jgi:hypothetical protein